MQIRKDKALKYFQEKNYIKSLDLFKELSSLEPNNLNYLIYISLNLMFLKDFEKAEVTLLKIKSINNNIAQLHFNLGVCYQHLKKYLKAIDAYKNAIAIDSMYSNAYINLGVLYSEINENDKALELYKRAIDQNICSEEILLNISNLYLNKNEFEKALVTSKKILSKNPTNVLAMNNIAKIYNETNHPAKAIEYLGDCLKIDPHSFVTNYNLGIFLKELGREAEAKKYLKRCIDINPNFYDAYFALGQIQLSENNFLLGWENYEFRWKKSKKRPKTIMTNKVIWDPSKGFKRILIWGEQGIGDQILFMTIIHEAAKSFQKIYLALDRRLVPIFNGALSNVHVFDISTLVPESMYDFHLPIASLGKYYRKTISSFQSNNIIEPQTNYCDKKKLNRSFNCAISLKSFNSETGSLRSINISELEELFKLKNINFFDIQYSSEEIKNEDPLRSNLKKIEDFDTYNDIESLFKFISKCDFVISICNTNAHIAGYLNIPTYVLQPLGKGDFWYWNNHYMNKNLWYPNVKVFKQAEQKDWNLPIATLIETLKDDFLN